MHPQQYCNARPIQFCKDWGWDVLQARKVFRHLTKQRFEIKYTPHNKKKCKPKWRNWQTRYVQGVVSVLS